MLDMRKIMLLSLLVFICVACTYKKENNTSLLSIPINVDDVTDDASTFLEKIEIVPLETNDSILFGYPSKILYDKKTICMSFPVK